MKRNGLAGLVLAALVFTGATAAQAQQGFLFGVGGGATVPLGDFNIDAKLGWHGLAIVGYNSATSPLGFRLDGLYGENKLDGSNGKTKLAGGLANGVYEFGGGGGARPYLIGGAGVFNVKVPAGSQTKFALGGGLGLAFPIGSDSRFFVEGRYVNVFTSNINTSFIPFTAGITFGVQ
jgi:opacity protein-like surface antigen